RANPAAAEDRLPVVEDGGLAGGHGALRNIEGDACAPTGESLDARGSGFVLVANLDLRGDGFLRLRDGNPVHRFDFKRSCAQRLVLAYNDAIALRMNR